jgi:dTMP kinase
LKFKIKNKFIVIEGIDGSGKTTLAKKMHGLLMDITGERAIYVCQPGTTEVGRRVREIVKDKFLEVPARVRQLLLEAARVDVLLEIERWKKEQPDEWVICDRHQDSTWAYQAEEGVPRNQIYYSQLAYDDLIKPDFTIYIRVNPEVAASRLGKDHRLSTDRYDTGTLDFFTKCVDGYERRILGNPSHYLVVDGSKSKEEVYEFVKNNLEFYV